MTAPLDGDAIAFAKLRPQTRRNEVQRALAQRRTPDGIQGTLIGAAVFLEAALQENGHRRLAAGGRAQQQQQAPANIRAGGGGLEVFHDTRQRLVDAEQLALEELPCPCALGGVAAAAVRPCQRSMSQMYSWLVRASAAGFAGRMSARNSPKVPSQRWARCNRLKELSDSMKAAWLFGSGSVESDRIVLPSRFSS